MTEDHDLGIVRVNSQVLDIMQRENSYTADLESRGFRQLLRPGLSIYISTYRSYRSNSLQFRENRGISDISGMDDEIRSFEFSERFRTQ
jgi:hypothetical protein